MRLFRVYNCCRVSDGWLRVCWVRAVGLSGFTMVESELFGFVGLRMECSGFVYIYIHICRVWDVRVECREAGPYYAMSKV